jgi:predicted nucleic acid-binding protein
MKVFLDTNILLDVLARRNPFFANAGKIWTMAEHGELEAFVSAFSFNNIYYIIRKAEGKAKAQKALKLLRDVFTSVAPDRQIMDQAMDSDLDDFEDAVQYFSAGRVHAKYLITRNPQDFPSDGLPVISPEEFVSLLETEPRLFAREA